MDPKPTVIEEPAPPQQIVPAPEDRAPRTEGPPRRSTAAEVLARAAKRNGFGAGVLVVGVVLLGFLVPNFLTTSNILNVLQQVSIIGVVSIGMVFVVLTAGIDLSVGSNLALTNVLFTLMIVHGLTPWLAAVLAVAMGGAFGLINGIGVAVFRLQPFVMTLATLATGAGVALTIANGSEIDFSRSDAVVNFLGNGGIGSFPGEFVAFAGVVALAWFVTKYVPFGRRVYAVGGSTETARLSGIPREAGCDCRLRHCRNVRRPGCGDDGLAALGGRTNGRQPDKPAGDRRGGHRWRESSWRQRSSDRRCNWRVRPSNHWQRSSAPWDESVLGGNDSGNSHHRCGTRRLPREPRVGPTEAPLGR